MGADVVRVAATADDKALDGLMSEVDAVGA
jgi:hypothetical protein